MNTPKKALLVTTVSGFVPQFEMNNVRLLQSMGYEVHYATNYNTPSYGTDNHRLDGTGIIRHQIDFVRSPFKLSNLTVYRQLYLLMKKEHFDLVHCHTPMGSVMARLAAHFTNTKPVIYTAHGFHFYKGVSKTNWLIYYPMERFLSRFTDQLICINQEDYQLAKKSFHAKYTNYIPGVGFDSNKIIHLNEQQILNKKKELQLPSDKIILLSSGELIKRKNHETIIRCIAKLKEHPDFSSSACSKIHYVICGHGKLDTYLKSLVNELKISDMVTFLGYREDIFEIYQIADIFMFPSYQEGLPMALLEAMASGLPVICSDIRGNQDLMGKPISQTDQLKIHPGGISIKSVSDIDAYCMAIHQLLENPKNLEILGKTNAEKCQAFSSEKVITSMQSIYQRMCNVQF